MKINKDSWHYKFVTEAIVEEKWNLPTNLCPYMRELCRVFLVSIILATSAVLMAYCVLMSIVLLPQISTVYDHSSGFFIACFSGWLMIGAAAVTCFCMWKEEKYPQGLIFKKKELNKVTTPNIFFAYIKSVHDKICPQLEFVEADKKEEK
jgi:hypothetical protein